jgi:small subunit ribosomal protein S2
MSKTNIKTPKVEEMLEAGVHFGHQLKRRSPFMDKYIYGTDNKTQVIDIYKTQELLQKAAEFVYDLASQGKQIVIVGTKRQASQIVKEMAEKSGLLYVNQRWLGGTFTNYSSIKGRIERLNYLIEAKKKGDLNKYTKKERLMFDREIEKLEEVVGGIRGIKKYPDALIVIDVKKERVAIREANASNVPVIALVDTNSDPRNIQYPIAANDDAIKSIGLILGVLADAAIEGYKNYKPAAEKSEVKVAAEKTAAPKAKVSNKK